MSNPKAIHFNRAASVRRHVQELYRKLARCPAWSLEAAALRKEVKVLESELQFYNQRLKGTAP